MSRLEESPGHLRRIAADIAAARGMSASILLTIADDVEAVLQLLPAAFVADDLPDVLPVFVRGQLQPDGSVSFVTIDRVDFPSPATMHVFIPGRGVVALPLGRATEDGVAMTLPDRPDGEPAPMCPVAGHTLPGEAGAPVATPVLGCPSCSAWIAGSTTRKDTT